MLWTRPTSKSEASSISSLSNIENGLALPGVDASDDYNDLAFALPANSVTYFARKLPLAQERLGKAAKIWEAP
jgi:hypothetical protein